MKAFLSNSDRLKIRSIANLIEANPRYHLSIPELGEKVYLNASKIKYGFKQEFGLGPYAFLQKVRIRIAKEMLIDGMTTKHVAISVGFKGASAETNFVKWFKKNEKATPGAWKQSMQSAQAS